MRLTTVRHRAVQRENSLQNVSGLGHLPKKAVGLLKSDKQIADERHHVAFKEDALVAHRLRHPVLRSLILLLQRSREPPQGVGEGSEDQGQVPLTDEVTFSDRRTVLTGYRTKEPPTTLQINN